jgi:hypothetical protein
MGIIGKILYKGFTNIFTTESTEKSIYHKDHQEIEGKAN